MLPAWEIKMLEAELEKLKQEREVKDNEAITRLAEYEGSGLSPEEVQELAKAKVEGRLLVPPVQVGDKIYHIGYSRKFGKKMIFTYNVSEVMYFSKRGERPWLFETYGGFRFDNLDIGKTVFLTKEEAKKALERSGQDGSRKNS